MKLGSLCSGYGGLDLAVEHVFGADVVWHSEVAPAPAQILSARWPGVPNFGDITRIDWATAPAVDILTAGYPCQPFSRAGSRKGTSDDRHLWPYVYRAICALRPRIVLLENVSGHRTLGLDIVLDDLAKVGLYEVRWDSVRASDAGAPHERERLFIAAAAVTPDTTWPRLQGYPAAEQRSYVACRAGAADRTLWELPHTAYRGEAEVDWGQYGAAIDHWAAIIGRRPTYPLVTGAHGAPVNSPRFVEWMMGLPAGWVTDVPGISIPDQLQVLGNGVVPQQAELAIRRLFWADCEVAA